MSELTFSCGVDLNSIDNQQMFRLETSKAANIAIALEQSGFPQNTATVRSSFFMTGAIVRNSRRSSAKLSVTGMMHW